MLPPSGRGGTSYGCPGTGCFVSIGVVLLSQFVAQEVRVNAITIKTIYTGIHCYLILVWTATKKDGTEYHDCY